MSGFTCMGKVREEAAAAASQAVVLSLQSHSLVRIRFRLQMLWLKAALAVSFSADDPVRGNNTVARI